MNNYCIKVKRKGFNYYTDYMERYFEIVANNYGYHLVKNPEQADFTCITFIDAPILGKGGSKWMIFMSKTFNEIGYEQLQVLSKQIAVSFKCESLIEECNMTDMKKTLEESLLKYGIPVIWYFSNKHNAFDEPPFITEGETNLKIVSCSLTCSIDQNFLVTFQNLGGVSKGLKIVTTQNPYLPR